MPLMVRKQIYIPKNQEERLKKVAEARWVSKEKKRKQAIRVIYELQRNRLGCLSIQCISEFFNAVTKGRKPLLIPGVRLVNPFAGTFELEKWL